MTRNVVIVGVSRKKYAQTQEMKKTEYTYIHSFIYLCDKYWVFGVTKLNLVGILNICGEVMNASPNR